jgi:hypothetical protein
MKVIDGVWVPEELKKVCFACDTGRCLGACCVEGDAGAPLTEEEISVLEDHTEVLLPRLTGAGRAVVERNGVFDWDMEGNYVTPLVNDRECAFAIFTDEGVAVCAIEQAWNAGEVPLRKPESCHLYPVRVNRMENGMTKLVYHRWGICTPALERGEKEGIPLAGFLREALTRKFGSGWVDLLLNGKKR